MAIDTKRSTTTLSGLASLLGLWLLVSPFFMASIAGLAARPNSIVAGIIIAALGSVHAFRAPQAAWLAWLNALVGLWVFASPWLLGFAPNAAALRNSVIVGALVAVLSVWSAITSGGQLRRAATA